MKAKLVVEGYIIGQHRSPYHGFSVEFAEHRSYEPGDEVKHIDWKLYGKTNRLYVKRFEEETNLRAHLILDTSKSMTYASGKVTKLDYGSYLLAALSYLMISQQDAAGVVLFDEKIITNFNKPNIDIEKSKTTSPAKNKLKSKKISKK